MNARSMVFAVTALLLTSAANASDNSEVQIKCKVDTIESAAQCMQSLANKMVEHNLVNDGMIAKNKRTALKVFEALNFNAAKMDLAKKADFIGAVGEYQDETHIFYYAISKGNESVPQLISDQNTVDIGSYVGQVDKILKLTPMDFALNDPSQVGGVIEEVMIDKFIELKEEIREKAERAEAQTPVGKCKAALKSSIESTYDGTSAESVRMSTRVNTITYEAKNPAIVLFEMDANFYVKWKKNKSESRELGGGRFAYDSTNKTCRSVGITEFVELKK